MMDDQGCPSISEVKSVPAEGMPTPENHIHPDTDRKNCPAFPRFEKMSIIHPLLSG
jgi:hypothetical protein